MAVRVLSKEFWCRHVELHEFRDAKYYCTGRKRCDQYDTPRIAGDAQRNREKNNVSWMEADVVKYHVIDNGQADERQFFRNFR